MVPLVRSSSSSGRSVPGVLVLSESPVGGQDDGVFGGVVLLVVLLALFGLVLV